MKYCNKVISKRFGLGHTNDFWQQYNLSFGKKKILKFASKEQNRKSNMLWIAETFFSPNNFQAWEMSNHKLFPLEK